MNPIYERAIRAAARDAKYGATQCLFNHKNTLAQNISGSTINDSSGNANNGALVQSNCLQFNGTTQYISAAHLTGSETVTSSGGTATPSIAAGRVNFTAGTCFDLLLSDGTYYPLSEGYGATIYDVSSNSRHGAAVNSPTWTTQSSFHYNIKNGFDSGANIYTYSEDFNNAAWSKTSAVILSDSTTAPNGTVTADKYVLNAGASNLSLRRIVTVLAGTQYTVSVYIKKSELDYAYVWFDNSGGLGWTVEVNMANGGSRVTRSYTGAIFNNFSYSVMTSANGFYKVSLTATTGISTTGVDFRLYNSDVAWVSGNYGTPIYTGDGTSGTFVWGAMLNLGGIRGYQKTTSANNIGVKIPATASGYIPSGLTDSVSNPASNGHNGAETKINFSYGSLPTAWAHGDAMPSGMTADINGGVYRNFRYVA